MKTCFSKNIVRSFILLFLSILSYQISYSQEYLFENITTKDGLASNTVATVFKDSKGYIWFGTHDAGVSRYDGKNFVNFNTSDGLAYNDVRKIYEDADGNIWFATHGGGISRYDGDSIITFNDKQGLQNNFVYSILQDSDGIFWLATWGGGIIRFDGKEFKQYSTEQGVGKLQISLFIDKKGTLWIGGHSGKGLYYYDREQDKFINFTEDDNYKRGAIWAIDEDNNGNILFSVYNIGFGKYDGTSFTYHYENQSKKGVIPLQFHNGDVWLGFNNNQGIVKWNSNKYKTIGVENGLTSATVWYLLIDDENIVWVCTLGGGVYKLMNEQITHYATGFGLPSNDINSMTISENGTTWVGFNDSGVYGIKGDSIFSHVNNNQLLNKNISLLANDNNDNLWVGVWGNGYYKIDEDGLDLKLKHQELGGTHPISFLDDNEGNLWFGNWLSGGVHKYNGKEFTKIKGIENPDVVSIARNKDKELYFAVLGGIMIWENGKRIGSYRVKDGMADITTGKIYLDKYNLLWIAHPKGGGISIVDINTNKWKIISVDDGFPSDVIKDFCLDGNGDFWIATGNGICKIEHQQKDVFKVINFEKHQSLKGLACTGIVYDKSLNRLLVSVSNDGLYAIPLSSLASKALPPKVYISSIYLNNINVNSLRADSLRNLDITVVSEDSNNYLMELPYFENNISFDLIGINHTSPNELYFQWKLNGYDKDWASVTSLNHINYTNLSGGDYLLEIRAINQANQKSETIRVKINIALPFWETKIFYAFCIIIILLSTIAVIKLRERKLNKQKAILESVVHERTQSLKEANSELVNQKNIIEEKNKEMSDSINYAKRIQNAILPPNKLVKEYLKNSFILYKPKDIVSGDFYWMEHKDGKILFAAADCTGHGVPGAMVSVVCNNGLNRSVREHGLTDPGLILDKTREIIIQEFDKSEDDVKDGMDIALCSLEGSTLKYAGAHNPLWIIRNGEIIETKANKQPIGKFDNMLPYTTHSFDLQKGDSIYIFSDGYIDQFGGEKGKKFKARAFRELLLSIQDKTMDEQKIIIDESFVSWRGDLEQIDDVCVIGVRY